MARLEIFGGNFGYFKWIEDLGKSVEIPWKIVKYFLKENKKNQILKIPQKNQHVMQKIKPKKSLKLRKSSRDQRTNLSKKKYDANE